MSGEIFISYRRADQAWARLLHAQLQAEGVEAWYDAQVGAGQDWRSSTARALKASRIFVLLFSSNGAMEVLLHVGALSLVALVWLVVLLSAERMQRALGPRVMTAFERLMGLILSAMSVEMLLAGIRAYVKTL